MKKKLLLLPLTFSLALFTSCSFFDNTQTQNSVRTQNSESSTNSTNNNINLNNVIFDNVTYTYNGDYHELVATNLPNGVTVEYTNNRHKDVGSYNVEAKLYYNNELIRTNNELTRTNNELTRTNNELNNKLTQTNDEMLKMKNTIKALVEHIRKNNPDFNIDDMK